MVCIIGRTIFDGAGPKTQSIEAVKALLAWRGRASDPLPSFVEVGEGEGRVVLVLSNKKDVYYTTTLRACSCPSATYHPGQPCTHMKALLAGDSVEASRAQAKAYQARQRDLRAQAKTSSLPEPTEPAKRLARPPEDSIRPTGGWIGPNGERANGPVEARALPF